MNKITRIIIYSALANFTLLYPYVKKGYKLTHPDSQKTCLLFSDDHTYKTITDNRIQCSDVLESLNNVLQHCVVITESKAFHGLSSQDSCTLDKVFKRLKKYNWNLNSSKQGYYSSPQNSTLTTWISWQLPLILCYFKHRDEAYFKNITIEGFDPRIIIQKPAPKHIKMDPELHSLFNATCMARMLEKVDNCLNNVQNMPEKAHAIATNFKKLFFPISESVPLEGSAVVDSPGSPKEEILHTSIYNHIFDVLAFEKIVTHLENNTSLVAFFAGEWHIENIKDYLLETGYIIEKTEEFTDSYNFKKQISNLTDLILPLKNTSLTYWNKIDLLTLLKGNSKNPGNSKSKPILKASEDIYKKMQMQSYITQSLSSYTTPIHAIITHNDLSYNKKVEYLNQFIKHKSPIDRYDSYGNTPLSLTINLGDDYESIVELLLKSGANPNKTISGDLNSIQYTLHKAAKSGFVKLCYLLIAYGAKINLQNKSGNTPLHYTIKKINKIKPSDRLQKLNILRLLLKQKANPNILNNKGINPLDIAQSYNDKKLIEMMSHTKSYNL